MSVETRTVTGDEADIRLDRWFRRHFPGVTQGAIQRLCRTGQVRVDGRRAEAATRLAPGQAVRVPPLPAGPAPAPRPALELDAAARRELEGTVLYRDDRLIVLNKPYGLPVQGGPGITRHLDAMLDAISFGGERPRLVHRLDRDTSGALVLARTPGTAAKLAAAFRGRDVEKILLGGGRWPSRAGRGAHRPAAEAHRRLPRRAYRARRAVRQGGGARDHRLSHPRPRRAEARLARTAASDGAHAPAPRALRGARSAGPGRRRVCGAGPERRGQRDRGRPAAILALARPRAAPAASRRRTVLVEADLPPHMRETFRTLGFQAPSAQPPLRR